MTTMTDASQEALSEYPLPLPIGTRVSLKIATSETNPPALGTVSEQKGKWGNDDSTGLHVLFDGRQETEYILASGTMTKNGVKEYFDVLSLPPLGEGIVYANGDPISAGDRVMRVPGFDNSIVAGTLATVLGLSGDGGDFATILVRVDDGPVSQQGWTYHQEGCTIARIGTGLDLDYEDGTTVRIGDRVERAESNDQGVVVAATGSAVQVKRTDTLTPALWDVALVHPIDHADPPAPVPAAEEDHIGLFYSDGVGIAVDDEVVINPGTGYAGKTGTVVERSDNMVRVDLEGVPGMTLWSPEHLSRLQDADKEKVADDTPSPTVLAKIAEALDEFEGMQDAVTEAISNIESELSNAENKEVSVELDASQVLDNITVDTNDDRIISMVSLSDGTLEIDAYDVDTYVRDECLTINADTVETTVSLSDELGDLHSSFAEGQKAVEALLTQVAQVAKLFEAALDDDSLTKKLGEVSTARFTGKIANARYGVVMPEDAEVGPTLRFDVIADTSEGLSDASTKATRRVRLVRGAVGRFLLAVKVSDVADLNGRECVLEEDDKGLWTPVKVAALAL